LKAPLAARRFVAHVFTPLDVRRVVGRRRGGERQRVRRDASDDYSRASRGSKGAMRLLAGIFVHSRSTRPSTLSVVVVMAADDFAAVFGRKF
jgi:hypothetical protein